MSDMREWLKDRTGHTVRGVAERAGIEPSTLARQLKKDTLTVQTVVAICRAYQLPFLDGFVAAGFLTDEEAATARQQADVRGLTSTDLAEELHRRAVTGEF